MIKKLILAIFLMFGTITLSFANEVHSAEEEADQIGHYAQKLAKTAYYIETIAEGIQYVTAIGKLDSNAVMGLLGSGWSDLDAFQNVLHLADASSFGPLLGYADSVGGFNGQIDGLKEEVSGFYDDINGSVGAPKSVADYSAEDEIADYSEEGYSENSNSAAQRVVVVERNFGQAQKSKAAAENFIRSRYYYSTKDGDVYEGEVLNDTAGANALVLKNRAGYYQEALIMSTATALEGLTTVSEESMKRLQELQKKVDKAESVDDKRAVEALIVQEEIRQRMLRLGLDLTALEKDLIDELQTVETNYIIARTVDQIRQDAGVLDAGEFQDDEASLKGEE